LVIGAAQAFPRVVTVHGALVTAQLPVAASELGVTLAATRAPPWKCTLTGQVYGGGGSLERGGGDKAMGAHRW
jgi:hypothetical protein